MTSASSATAAGRRVMIVEDNALNMKLFCDLLKAHGYTTTSLGTGVEAVPTAKAEKPDVILMDMQLPDVPGMEVTRWLKADAETQHIPVIAITAFAMKGDEERIRQAGCDDYIAKPIAVGNFLETVRKYAPLG